jgi:hypothetical protein
MWDDDLRDLAKLHVEAWASVKERRDVWNRHAAETILPTLERAAQVLRDAGFVLACAERKVFGSNLESVQLHTGSRPTLVMLEADFAARREAAIPSVIEVGPTLGYSLGVSGRVRRWHIEPWFESLGPRHPKPDYLEVLPDAAALTSALLQRHILEFAKTMLGLSFTAREVEDRQIGFVVEPRGEGT